jgi:hypothetical protein
MSGYSNNDVLPSPFLWGRLDAGPTHGYVRRPLFAERVITANDSLQNCDFQLVVRPPIAANISIQFPTARSWLNNPLGGTPILVQDMMQVATNGVTIALLMSDTDTVFSLTKVA